MSGGGQARRLLFIDLQLPEPDRHASSLRSSQLLTLLRRWGWEVDFLPLMSSWTPHQARVVDALAVRPLPWLPAGEAEHFVAGRAAGYDLIYMAWAVTARRLLDIVRQAAPHRPLIYDTQDVNHLREFREARLTGNARTLARSLHTKQIELRALRSADVVLAITPADQAILQGLAPEAAIETVEMWTEPAPLRRQPEPATLLFVGNMGAPHNHDCALHLINGIMPLLRPEVPGLSLILAGPDPHPTLQALAGPDVAIPGWVPDLEPLFARASLFVAPLRFGSGLKGKMLQAMALGLPIVASSMASEGMPLTDGLDYLRADDAAATAAAVRRLLADPALGERLAGQALETLRAHYGQARIERQFAAALDRALAVRVAAQPSPG